MAMRDFEVSMDRRTCMNASQNARKRIEYVRASDHAEAKKIAERKRPEFKAISSREVK